MTPVPRRKNPYRDSFRLIIGPGISLHYDPP
jgi:hypothetical protein